MPPGEKGRVPVDRVGVEEFVIVSGRPDDSIGGQREGGEGGW